MGLSFGLVYARGLPKAAAPARTQPRSGHSWKGRTTWREVECPCPSPAGSTPRCQQTRKRMRNLRKLQKSGSPRFYECRRVSCFCGDRCCEFLWMSWIFSQVSLWNAAQRSPAPLEDCWPALCLQPEIRMKNQYDHFKTWRQQPYIHLYIFGQLFGGRTALFLQNQIVILG